MGTISSGKCMDIIKIAQKVIAIELLCGVQAMDLFTNIQGGQGTSEICKTIRKHVKHLEEDRILATDIQIVLDLIKNGTIIEAVEYKIGKLD